MIKIKCLDGTAVFLNTFWIEAVKTVFVEGVRKHVTRIYIHQGSFQAAVDTQEAPEELAERISIASLGGIFTDATLA